MEYIILPLILFFIIRIIVRKTKKTNMSIKPYRYNIQTRKSRHSWKLGF
jgi:ACR3 family arsenite efflux pump ArsB